MPEPELHDAVRGFARGARAYEQGRPGYTQTVLAKLADVLGLRAGRTVIELGAGTGKFTRGLVRTGARVVAVEPIEAMRALLRERVPEAVALEGTAEAIPCDDASADAVVAAQSFHWFRPEPTAREIARVLRSGGGVGLVWNLRDERVPWVAEFGRIIHQHEPPGVPSHRHGTWRSVFDDRSRFSPLASAEFEHSTPMEADDVVARALSVSYIATLPEPTQRTVAVEVRELLRSSGLVGTIPFPYRTEVFWCYRA